MDVFVQSNRRSSSSTINTVSVILLTLWTFSNSKLIGSGNPETVLYNNTDEKKILKFQEVGSQSIYIYIRNNSIHLFIFQAIDDSHISNHIQLDRVTRTENSRAKEYKTSTITKPQTMWKYVGVNYGHFTCALCCRKENILVVLWKNDLFFHLLHFRFHFLIIKWLLMC